MIKLKKTSRVSGRIVDQAGRGKGGQAVEVRAEGVVRVEPVNFNPAWSDSRPARCERARTGRSRRPRISWSARRTAS